jgi:hypothetical protein
VFRRLLTPLLLAALAACSRSDAPPPPVAAEYVGDSACLACHTERKSFLSTAHHLTSAPASRATVHGSFAPGENVVHTSNPYLHYRMEARPDGLYQSAVVDQPPDTITRRFDLVIGSGRKGQSYLYWKGDRLFELPVSYWRSLQSWVNSPGYSDRSANFDRPAAPRCLECHATYFRSVSEDGFGNRYDREHYLLGVYCEKCHGPGREHVAREGSWKRQLGPAIVNPRKLARPRELAVCALCHGGIARETAPAFTYRPGQPLDRYLVLQPPLPGEEIDVHGNQVALLARSRCFQASEMTCSTCHDVHRTQRDAAAFSGRCLTCHEVKSCGLFPTHGQSLQGECVSCHMPELTSNVIFSTSEGRTTRPKVRSHWIKVYPDSLAR